MGKSREELRILTNEFGEYVIASSNPPERGKVKAMVLGTTGRYLASM